MAGVALARATIAPGISSLLSASLLTFPGQPLSRFAGNLIHVTPPQLVALAARKSAYDAYKVDERLDAIWGRPTLTKLRFLVSLITKDNDFQLQQGASAEAAARGLDVELDVVYADGDTITQSTQILKSIQAPESLRPAAIIVEPAGGTGLPQVAKAAGAASIGWALLNREADYIAELRRGFKIPAFVVTSDHREVGRIQGRQLGALLPEGGAALYISGPAESSTAKDRKAGFDEACPANLHLTNLRGRWTEESGHRAVRSWLKLGVSHKLRGCALVSQNDAMAIGARKAFEQYDNPQEREKWLALPFIGCDGLPKTGQAWVRSGLLAATVIASPMAGKAVQLMTQALRSAMNVPEKTITPLESYPPIERLSRVQPARTE